MTLARSSVMEGADRRVHHRDAVFPTCALDVGVTRGAAGLGDELDAVALRMIDVVAEGNETVGDHAHTGDALELMSLLPEGSVDCVITSPP